METEIRRATPHDIKSIAEIIRLAFDDIVDIERVSQLLTFSHNFVYVAVQLGTVVGFVENFVTVSQDKQIRLELDLLAVHPNARGQGIGKKLIEASIMLSMQLGVDCLRALIATENRVMQGACQRMNLIPSKSEFSLYVKSPEKIVQPIIEAPAAHLIRVETLTYKGIWLEGHITESVVNNAHLIGLANQCDILGTVVDKTDTATINLLTKKQFIHINDYRRWIFNLKSD